MNACCEAEKNGKKNQKLNSLILFTHSGPENYARNESAEKDAFDDSRSIGSLGDDPHPRHSSPQSSSSTNGSSPRDRIPFQRNLQQPMISPTSTTTNNPSTGANALASVQAALTALQAGQMSLNQVRTPLILRFPYSSLFKTSFSFNSISK